MSSYLDVIGAVLVFGIVLMLSLQLNIFTLEKNSQNILRTANQEKITGVGTEAGLSGMLEYDFSKIGAGDSLSPSVLVADSNRITVRGDFDGNGTVDSLKYYLTTPGSLPAGTNQNLKYLYRRQNQESGAAGRVGVSYFQLSYLDNRGRVIPTPVAGSSLSDIRSIRVKMMVESSIRLKNDFDTTYAASYWETLISPPNIR